MTSSKLLEAPFGDRSAFSGGGTRLLSGVDVSLTLTNLRSDIQYPLRYDMDRQKMEMDLNILESKYNNAAWLINHDHEPLIGDFDCPSLAQDYGIARTSCFSVFLEKVNEGTYLCRFERCHGFPPCSLEDALRHQRYSHFDHRPFLCAPANGKQW